MYSQKQDWLERQIEAIGKTFAAILFGKDKIYSIYNEVDEKKSETENRLLDFQIDTYITLDKIAEMEKLIFETVSKNKSCENLMAALEFYNKISELSEDKLEKNGFSIEKIKTGIEKLRKVFDEK